MKESKYKTITSEQEKQIKDLFDASTYNETEFKFETLEDGYHITASRMYDYVTFKNLSVLQGYLKLAQILGCENGDETNRYSYSGCETCDYGSSYTISLRLW